MVDESHDFFEQQWSRSSSNRTPFRSNFSIPSSQVISVSTWISSTDSSLIDKFVEQKVKDSPVSVAEGRGKLYAYEVVREDQGKSLLHIVMIANDPEGVTRAKANSVRGFYPAFAFIPAPDEGLCLWLEAGNWVAGFSRDNKWVQIATLGRLQPAMLMQRIQQIYADLLLKEAINEFDKVKILGAPDREISEFFEGEPIDFHPLQLRSPNSYSITPNLVGDQKHRKQLIRNWLLSGVGVGLLILGLVAIAWMRLESKEKQIAAAQQQLDELLPVATEISNQKSRWDDLGAASVPQKSPIEVLYQLSKLAGQKGIRISDFEYVGDNVNFSVQATTVKDAARFEEALKKSEKSTGFSWVPGRHEFVNQIYSFRCSGKWEGVSNDP